MPLLELWLWLWTLACLGVGIWGICWAKAVGGSARATGGRGLFLGALIFLGAAIVVGAAQRVDGLAAQGLTAGLLLVGMLWENPVPLPETH